LARADFQSQCAVGVGVAIGVSISAGVAVGAGVVGVGVETGLGGEVLCHDVVSTADR